MGHDIIAGDFSDQNIDQLRGALSRTAYPSQHAWNTRLDVCQPQHFAAHLRRSAFDPLGRVIYQALSAESLYTGLSGKGEALYFDLKAIQAALELLPGISMTPLPIDTTVMDKMYDEIIKNLSISETKRIELSKGEKDGPGITEEYDFLSGILAWMEANDTEQVRIFFG